MTFRRVVLLCFVIGSGAWGSCGGSSSPNGGGGGGNGAPANSPTAMCDGGSCKSGDHDGEDGDMGDEVGEGDGEDTDGGMPKADGGHHGDGGDDDGND